MVDEFNDICAGIFARIENKINGFFAYYSKKFSKSDIGKIVLAGSSCHIRRIQDIVEKIFGRRANSELPLGELVARGACYVAEMNTGVESATGSRPQIRHEDILSHSMGVEIRKGKRCVLSKILAKDTPYPCSATEHYTTVYDNQKEVCLNIYEVSDNIYETDLDISLHNLYGSMVLDGIQVAKAGVPDIVVTFSYDKSRTLTVTAKDSRTNVAKTVTIEKGKKTKAAQREQPMDLVVLLDSSGSMSGVEMKEAQAACRTLVEEMIDFSIHRMALISFDDYPIKQCGLSNNRNTLLKKIYEISAGGMTNMLAPFKMAHEELKDNQNNRVIIMVTDGYPTESEAETVRFVGKLKKDFGIRVVIIGAGGGVNMNYLQSLASSNKDVYKIDNMSALRKTFERVVGEITK